MTPPLAAEEITVLLEGLDVLRRQTDTTIAFAQKHQQGTARIHTLVSMGSLQTRVASVDLRLREQLARLTGMPIIQHGNTDIHDAALAAAQANTRG